MNFYDSSVTERILIEQGLTSASSPLEADVILVNTCSVRAHAEERAWGTIGSLKRIKQKNPGLKIAVMGCMAERLGRKIVELAPHINLVLGTHHLRSVKLLLEPELADRRAIVKIGEAEKPYHELQGMSGNSVVAFVAAMKGCNSFCTYCVVPYTRGREKSRPIPEIVEEIKQLVEHQDREILLLGQNITAYGRDLNLKTGFLNLLEEVHKVDGVIRLRYLTPHPKDFSPAILEGLKNLPRVPEYFHLPIQSGDDEVLRAMNRGYTTADYLKLVDKIREEFPEFSLSTDVIVGFPTETEESFLNTLNLFRKVEFDYAYVAIYSHRPEALASRLYPQDIPLKEKKRRHQILNQLQEETSFKKNQRLVGQVVEVLVEEFSRKHNAFSGRTRTNKIVSFPSEKTDLIGKLVNVHIEEAGSWVLRGGEI